MHSPPISFEFFPPKTDAGLTRLGDVASELSKFDPEFFSVTYGAGGGTREGTIHTVQEIQTKTQVLTAPHLACMGETPESLTSLLDTYRHSGIKRILALRGDLPSLKTTAHAPCYAHQLVRLIREHSDKHFHITVAAYPECHPETSHLETDIRHFVEKAACGADAAITQYFYNVDSYLYFRDRCLTLGVTIPIIPGIMPIGNFAKLARFSAACGADIPRWIVRQLENQDFESESCVAFAHEVVLRLCERLKIEGAPGFHFYSLNQLEPTRKLCDALGYCT